MSYSHFDNEHEDGFISKCVERFKNEVEARRGCDIEIFIDAVGLRWGDLWQDEIHREIERSDYFVLFLSPKYLASGDCRAELTAFLEVEKTRSWARRVLPVIFIDPLEFLDPAIARDPEATRLAGVLRQRQWADISDLRGRPANSEPVRQRIQELASDLAERLLLDNADAGPGNSLPAWAAHPLPDFVPRDVLGRVEIIEDLSTALAEPRAILLALVGDPGVGKTAVATHVARQLARRASVRYLTARGYPPVNAESMLSAIATVSPDERERPKIAAMRATVLERLDATLRAVADRRVLLVVDDGGDLLDDRRDLRDTVLATVLEDLAQHDGHHVQVLLVTSREPRSPLFRLVPMTGGLSREEFGSFLNVLDPGALIVPPPERGRFAAATQRWPRPAEFVHGVLIGQQVSATQMLDAAVGGVSLLQCAEAGCDERELGVLRLLAACGRPLPAAAVTMLTGHDADDVLIRLTDRRILRRTARGHEIGYHLPEAPGWLVITDSDLRRRAAEYFEARCQEIVDEQVRLDDLGCYFEAIELYLACGDHEAALRLAREVDEDHLAGRGQTTVLMPYLRQLADVLAAPHPKMVATLMLARALVLQGDPAESIAVAKEAVRLADALQETDDVLIALSQVGTGYFESGQVTEAAKWHDRVIERGVGRPSRADAYHDLACCRLETGFPEEARTLLAAAGRELDQRPEFDDDDRALAAKMLLTEALIALELGEDSGPKAARQARRAAQAGGEELDAARCDDIEAWALLRLGDHLGAMRAARNAFAVAGRIGDPVLCRVTGVTLAVLHLLREEFDDGHRAADVAVRSSRSHPAAGALAIRGVAEFRLNRWHAAEGWFARAVELARPICDLESGNYQAHEACGLALAGLALAGGRPHDDVDAAAAYRRALGHRNLRGARFRRQRMLAALIGDRGADELPHVRAVLGL